MAEHSDLSFDVHDNDKLMRLDESVAGIFEIGKQTKRLAEGEPDPGRRLTQILRQGSLLC